MFERDETRTSLLNHHNTVIVLARTNTKSTRQVERYTLTRHSLDDALLDIHDMCNSLIVERDQH